MLMDLAVQVEAYTASWIEILTKVLSDTRSRSRLIQPRGLKYIPASILLLLHTVEAYTASWIEMIIFCTYLRLILSRGLYSLVD